MNRQELRKVDLNIMVIFERVTQELNVTRAAKSLGISQPTVTAALNKLRRILEDPLFILNGQGIEPTARAYQVYQEITPALDELTRALSSQLRPQSHPFKPINLTETSSLDR
ncbi:LysR family transcriptional regulator [Pseudomonas sp. LAIL14HWK12:I9]|uniref:LysR family transcriptional regulator n=1 Tax=Pseudomonas sp. LAIL14HWK12:I9 TaxID=1259804 RepID=UPI00048651E0|nr:LysR family transcriptional regulator [Pseudomonas sp. LAIL14HWK12:I9]